MISSDLRRHKPISSILLLAAISMIMIYAHISFNYKENIKIISAHNKNTTIFIITPTYRRPTQMADMTRLAQTLMLVKDIFWIVVEDCANETKSISALLDRSHIPHIHLLAPRPKDRRKLSSGRGVSNRLRALEWLRNSYSGTTQEGVMYFADDDNSYDIRLFEQIRDTKVVSMFPVGLIPGYGLSSPIVDSTSGKVIGFHDPYIETRIFVVDMAGFAVNLQFFLSKPNATMQYKVGYIEDSFLISLGIKFTDIEPKADNCTQILVWHTQTVNATQPKYRNLKKVKHYNNTNMLTLYENVINY